MRTGWLLGVVLIVFGAIGLAYQGITYTTREKVVDLPGVKIEADREHTFPIAPVVAGSMLAAGVVILLVSEKRP